jgi:hypothetical protein
MLSFCYTWSDADVIWNQVEITWREACVLQKVLGGGSYSRAPHSPNTLRNRLKKLKKEEQDVLIKLVARIIDNDKTIETKMNKNKNGKVKVTIKKVELVLKEAKKINLKVFINENNS